MKGKYREADLIVKSIEYSVNNNNVFLKPSLNFLDGDVNNI